MAKPSGKNNSNQANRNTAMSVSDQLYKLFGWEESIVLRQSTKKVDFKINLHQTAGENLNRIKKKYRISNEDYDKYLKNLESDLMIYIFEKTKYNKKVIDRHIRGITQPENKKYFRESIKNLIKKIEINADNHYHNRLENFIILGITFEYACKYVLLNRNLSINEPKKTNKSYRKLVNFWNRIVKRLNFPQKFQIILDRKKVLSFDNLSKLNPSRTISLYVAWEYIIKEKLINLKEKEITQGNFLNLSRDLTSHTPYLLPERGSYIDDSLNLIKKLIGYESDSDEQINELVESLKSHKK